MAKNNRTAEIMSRWLAKSGRNVAYIPYADKIQEYLDWWRGTTNFHDYKYFNGKTNIKGRRASLSMAKTLTEDKASLLMNEKVEIMLSDENSQEFINNVLEANAFKLNANKLEELKQALGTSAYVVGFDRKEDGELSFWIDFIHGDMIFPLAWDNGGVTECAFACVEKADGKIYFRIIEHVLNEEGTYVIRTSFIDNKGDVVKPSTLGSKYRDEDFEEFDTKCKYPLFQVMTTSIVNNYDKVCPLGMSCFGNAIEVLKSIDTIYDSLRNEFTMGRKRIFVKSDLKSVYIESQGDRVYDIIDDNDEVFYRLGTDWDKAPIYESDMKLRVAEHIEGLNLQLKLLSRKAGMGENFYTFMDGGVAKTATEVVSSNSALFRNIKKEELGLEKALIGLCRGLLELAQIHGGMPFDPEQEITVNFDDSIIEDTEKEQLKATNEFNNYLIDQVQYFMDTRKMTEKQAIEFVAKMKARDTMKAVNSVIGGGTIEDSIF